MPENGDRPEGSDQPLEDVLSLEDLVDEPLGPDCLAGLPADRYTPVARLGEGTFGEVIRAHDGALDRDVAVKRIRLEAFSAPGELEEVKQRFVREARVAAQLRHPNVVTTHDIVSTPRSSLIVMELVEGRDLETLLRERGRLGLDETLDLLGQVASALDHAHEGGVIHRDIKPANIMVEPSGRVKVMDFGIAKVERGGHLTSTGLIMGTPHYMSPEQARGEKVDARADVFSLGCVLYECLSGTKPFQADTVTGILLKVTVEPPPPLDFDALGLPRALDAVLRRALAKEPRSRFGSAGELLEASRLAARGIEPPPPPLSPGGTLVGSSSPAGSAVAVPREAGLPSSDSRQAEASRPSERPFWPLAALAMALVVAATVGVVALRELQSGAPPPPAAGDRLVVEEEPGFFGRLLGREARLHITVPGETALSLQMTAEVGSATTQTGETFDAELIEPIVIEGHEAMGLGTRVGGRVAEAEPASETQRRGRLTLLFDHVVLADGTRVPIESDPVELLAPPPRPAKSRKTGLAGAWAKVTSTVGDIVRDVKGEDRSGGIAGARAVQSGGGMDVELPAGSTLDVVLTRPVTVARPRDRRGPADTPLSAE